MEKEENWQLVLKLNKMKISEEMLEELLYFPNTKFPKKSTEDIVSNKLSVALLAKRSSEGLSGDIDDVILQMVYGNSREPPGDEKSPSRSLMTKNDEDEDEENTIIGIWAPPNALAKAVALKVLFPNLSGPFKLNGIEPDPLCVAVCYDAFKARDLMELSAQYPGQVISYGFFTSDIPAEAQLISKTMEEFEARTTPTSYEEKVVIQLAKTNPECFMAFSELGPSYMSSDAVVGEMECKIFFPPGYNAPVVTVKEVKKKGKKRGRKHTPAVNKEEEASIAASDANIDQSEIDHIEDENDEQESDEEKPSESVDTDNDILSGADKATSPMHEEKVEE